MKDTLCIIPARKGSKGVKNKNFIKIKGKMLIQYTIDVAKKLSNELEIVISSDSSEVEKICKKNKLNFYGKRPMLLSGDNVETIKVVKYEIIKQIKKGRNFKYVLLLQPTCPIRDVKKIKFALKKIKLNKIDSIVSVCDVEQYHPLRMKKIIRGRLVNFIKQPKENMRPRQKLPKVYIRSGSIYLTKISKFLKNNSIVSGNVYPIITKKLENINIDTTNDLNLFKKNLN